MLYKHQMIAMLPQHALFVVAFTDLTAVKTLKKTDFLHGHYIRYCQQLRRDTASRAAAFPNTSGDVLVTRAPVHTLEAAPVDLPLENLHGSDGESVTDFQNARR